MAVLRSLFDLLPRDVQHRVRGTVRRIRATKPRTTSALMERALPNLSPLNIVPATENGNAVTMVTDSVASGQLLGGVGTAVLLAATIAQSRGWTLRIVTRMFRTDDMAVRALLKLQNVVYSGPIEVIFSDGSPGSAGVPLSERDLVLTTSWWGTWSTRRTVPDDQIVYLLQEDERMFYPHDDRHLLCDETLNSTDIRFVVNSELLMSHFRDSGTAGPSTRGISFEPAFPDEIYYPAKHAGRRNLLFYARPDHPRNLFLRGLQALEQAFAEGMFPADRWDVHFFGMGITKVDFGGRSITYHDALSWSDYAALIRKADLGLSLMYTPHPSYPPLDLAASGAVVVTNSFGPKGTAAHYCENIFYCALEVDALVNGLRRGVERVEDPSARRTAHASARLNRDWATAFAPVLAALHKGSPDAAPQPD